MLAVRYKNSKMHLKHFQTFFVLIVLALSYMPKMNGVSFKGTIKNSNR